MEASDSRGKWSSSPLGPSCGHMRRRPRLLLRPAAGDSSPVPGPPKYRVAGVVWSAGDGPRKRARRGTLGQKRTPAPTRGSSDIGLKTRSLTTTPPIRPPHPPWPPWGAWGHRIRRLRPLGRKSPALGASNHDWSPDGRRIESVDRGRRTQAPPTPDPPPGTRDSAFSTPPQHPTSRNFSISRSSVRR